ncbi:hypothetical protein EDM22_18800 [Agromyces tardus]|jgi:hypothetical protein|uniref:Uncharacterized protein n=1 Tax=Agromyces tardus TaxID=2583849 RepID=A0A3M7ZXD6_9MICO|nr:hypothetical protein [Agromyces tardus]RNB43371.1 hypothetical protein EDM22_18800 [Agromyces tardus]
MDVVIEAAEAAVKAPNLWGALGCALTYAAALFATVDAFADLLLTPGDTPDGRLSPALRLKAGSKLSAAGIAVVSAAIVLALDSNWFAFTTLGVAFVLLTGLGAFVLVRQRALVARLASERPGWPDGGASDARPLA